MNLFKKLFSLIFKKKIIIVLIASCTVLVGGYTLLQVTKAPTIIAQAGKPAPAEVTGKVITLRTLKEEYYVDYHNMLSLIVRQSLEFPEHMTLGETISYLRDEQTRVDSGKLLNYCIFDNKDNKLIGSIEIRDKTDADRGQLGCWLNEAYWGGGRIRQAIDLASMVYFKIHPEEPSYIAHVRLWNKRSYHALIKAGLKDAGYFYEGGKATRYILEMKRY